MQDETLMTHLMDIKDNMATKKDVDTLHNRIDKKDEKIDTVDTEVKDVQERVTRIEEKQQSNFESNDEAHNKITSLIVETKEELDGVSKVVNGHNSQLTERKGVHKVVWWIVGALLSLAAGSGWIVLFTR